MKFSRDYVLFCHITTQVSTDKHQDLLEQKGGEGFPHIVFMDAAGTVIATHEGSRDAAGFGKTGERARAFVDTKKKADAGDAAAKAELVLLRLEMGQTPLKEALESLKDAKLSEEQKTRLATMQADLEIREILDGIQDEARADAAAKKFIERKKSGKPAPAGEREFQMYWIIMIAHAEKQKDIPLFEEALKALKAKYGAVEEAKKFLESKDETLKTLKEEKK